MVKIKIFYIFIENQPHHLCNMILEEKETQAVRDALETSPIFSVRDLWLKYSAFPLYLTS